MTWKSSEALDRGLPVIWVQGSMVGDVEGALSRTGIITIEPHFSSVASPMENHPAKPIYFHKVAAAANMGDDREIRGLRCKVIINHLFLVRGHSEATVG